LIQKLTKENKRIMKLMVKIRSKTLSEDWLILNLSYNYELKKAAHPFRKADFNINCCLISYTDKKSFP
jgi:hypothetical protein